MKTVSTDLINHMHITSTPSQRIYSPRFTLLQTYSEKKLCHYETTLIKYFQRRQYR
jgi:tRNA A37 threonylcarbamoyladenosine biosynthesis protein TsaE